MKKIIKKKTLPKQNIASTEEDAARKLPKKNPKQILIATEEDAA